MDNKNGLSELATTYLKYLGDIKAGQSAVQADARSLLARLAERVCGTVDSDDFLTGQELVGCKVWAADFDLYLVFRLHWNPPEYDWPTLTVNRYPSDLMERSMRHLFNADVLSRVSLPLVDQDRLQVDAFSEITRLWDEGTNSCSQQLRDQDTFFRYQGWSIVKVFSKGFKSAIGQGALESVKESTAFEDVSCDSGFPCYFQWEQVLSDGSTLSWWVNFEPRNQAQKKAPMLSLMLSNWQGHRNVFEKVAGKVLPSVKYLVLADWDCFLREATEDGVEPSIIGARLLDEAVALFQNARGLMDSDG